ncbi:hypothetical protein M0811_03714 [Anaeramoeba ignava]|uniref:RING-type domain-containing protein n=1 Tax=Anaeramoeba ignava TaxID=1746090 RepID=A0A9Q0LWW6_ANAIG|nr:hypothetical protein M0811_03714 [Anaeramoeba ignava]
MKKTKKQMENMKEKKQRKNQKVSKNTNNSSKKYSLLKEDQQDIIDNETKSGTEKQKEIELEIEMNSLSEVEEKPKENKKKKKKKKNKNILLNPEDVYICSDVKVFPQNSKEMQYSSEIFPFSLFEPNFQFKYQQQLSKYYPLVIIIKPKKSEKWTSKFPQFENTIHSKNRLQMYKENQFEEKEKLLENDERNSLTGYEIEEEIKTGRYLEKERSEILLENDDDYDDYNYNGMNYSKEKEKKGIEEIEFFIRNHIDQVKFINFKIIIIHFPKESLNPVVLHNLVVIDENIYSVDEVYGNNDFDSNECVVCMERKRNVILLPCRHMFICNLCLKNIDRCPVCRAQFSSHFVFV